jgi:hypothetical protein
MPLFVLVHSPLVGPASWAPVARELQRAGCDAVVPPLRAAVSGGPPFWPLVAAAVAGRVPPGATGVVLAAHSNAGVFIPVIRRALAARPACSVFVDATVPPAAGVTQNTEDTFVAFLRGLAGPDGRVPPWTGWWSEDEVAELFPGPEARERVSAEQPRLPLSFFTEQVPIPAGWDDHPCGYLRFSEAYDGPARAAAERGWPVRALPGRHLHQLAEPAAVAGCLLEMAGLSGRRG